MPFLAPDPDLHVRAISEVDSPEPHVLVATAENLLGTAADRIITTAQLIAFAADRYAVRMNAR